MDSLLGEEVFEYIIYYSCSVIDEYNDQLLMLAKGMITVERFIEKNNNCNLTSAGEKQIRLAIRVFKNLCETLDNREWNYEKDEENLIVTLGVSGDDIPMQFGIYVDMERQLACLLSYFPFKMCAEKRVDGVIAINAASFDMVDGNFDCDILDG